MLRKRFFRMNAKFPFMFKVKLLLYAVLCEITGQIVNIEICDKKTYISIGTSYPLPRHWDSGYTCMCGGWILCKPVIFYHKNES